MPDIVALLQCFQPFLAAKTLRQFSKITSAMLAMTGRVTMLGLSRWAGQGGSYRTVQRFFCTALPWATLFWVFFRQHLYQPDEVHILAGDEVVVTKDGDATYGLDRFFAGLLRVCENISRPWDPEAGACGCGPDGIWYGRNLSM